MKPEFKQNVILHIEDDSNWKEIVYNQIRRSDKIKFVYGDNLYYIDSTFEDALPQDNLEAEIKRISSEIVKDNPTLVSITTAQIAREFLGVYLPGVIISDTSFPLNGKRVVEWICEHGFNDYALIGLSGTNIDDVGPELKNWFAQGNARYFMKTKFSMDPSVRSDFFSQIIRNRLDNISRYGGAQK